MDEPLTDVVGLQADDVEALLSVRAWEVQESPSDLGYEVVPNWPKIPSSWTLGSVAGVAIDSKGRYWRGNEIVRVRPEYRPYTLTWRWGGGSVSIKGDLERCIGIV